MRLIKARARAESDMYLIDIRTLELEWHPCNFVPAYVTLSHRWLRDEDEVMFKEYPDELRRYNQGKAVKKGFEKIANLCRFVRENRLVIDWTDSVGHVWVDTCCIDKRSSSMLSESINSMSRWYSDAMLCVAFLSDVPDGGPDRTIWQSDWFTRGWCLQELLFPPDVVFCNETWGVLGRKSEGWFRERLSKRTGIDIECLEDRDVMVKQCVAKKMSWASQRVTKRTEDLAYCLLGLFNIHMALLYGEGMNAFARLQEEIVRQTDDESVFAWTLPNANAEEWATWKRNKNSALMIRSPSILAPHPRYFEKCSRAHLASDKGRLPYRMTNKGLEFECPALEVKNTMLGPDKVVVIELNCGNVVDVSGEETQDRSCLVVLGKVGRDKYVRLELDPREAAKALGGEGGMWQFIGGCDAEKTTLMEVPETLFHIQTLSSAKVAGAQGFKDDGSFMTLAKTLGGRVKKSQRSRPR